MFDELSGREEHERDCGSDTIGQIDKDDAYLHGSKHSEKPWILSDRDVWVQNPYYVGPSVPHPDDFYAEPEQTPDDVNVHMRPDDSVENWLDDQRVLGPCPFGDDYLPF